MIVKDVEELLRLIKQKNVYIYGVGFIGKLFFEELKGYGLEKRTKSFVTTDNREKNCLSLPIKGISEIEKNFDKENDLICIATHETSVESIEKQLKKHNIYEYIWIYPFFHELKFGKPLEENKIVQVKEVMLSCVETYEMPIRLAAIECYYRKNSIGYEIYKKGINLHANKQTAEKRLERFVNLIKRWEEVGYDNDSRIMITENGRVIDGAHRLSLALYHKCNNIRCDIYKDIKYEKLITDDVMITEEKIEVFTKEEKRLLEEIRKRIENYCLKC